MKIGCSNRCFFVFTSPFLRLPLRYIFGLWRLNTFLDVQNRLQNSILFQHTHPELRYSVTKKENKTKSHSRQNHQTKVKFLNATVCLFLRYNFIAFNLKLNWAATFSLCLCMYRSVSTLFICFSDFSMFGCLFAFIFVFSSENEQLPKGIQCSKVNVQFKL